MKNTHFTIFSNSLSCLQSLHNMNIDHPYDPSSISYIYHQVVEEGKQVNYVGFPSISAFMATIKQIMAAKSALQFEVVKFKISYTDLKCIIKSFLGVL